MSQATFEEVVRAWLLDYDGRLPSERRERKEAFLVLLGNLATYGYGKDEINSGKKEKIVRSCVNPNHNNKKKLRNWISMVVNDLEDAILIYYGNIKINRDVITPEMSAKLDGLAKRAEETKALRTEDTEDASEEDSFSLEGQALDIEGAVREAVSNPKPIPVESIELTDEMLKDIDAPEILWDEDFSKRLGLDSDE
jgi:hypothetical protein